MQVYYIEPCMQLSDDEKRRLVRAVREVEIAAASLSLSQGYRIFDAYVTGDPSDELHIGEAFFIRHQPRTRPRVIHKRRKWWKRRAR